MKILHILRTPVGGLFRHVCDLAGAQRARGHEVGVLYDASTSDALTAARLQALAPDCALGIHGVPMSRALAPGDIRGVFATRRLAVRLGADILHGHGAKGGAFARLAAATFAHALSGGVSEGAGDARPRAFYTPHGGSLHYDPASTAGRVFFALERGLERWTDGLIFESAYSAKVYADKIGLPRCPTRIIHNGLQPAELVPVPAAPDAADFVYVGELRHLKGVDVLLHALARPFAGEQAAARRPTAVIVGAGPDAAAFKRLADELGLSNRVRFPGAMPARAAFALGRTLVVPSRAESFPYIVLEAAAAGLPLIASDVGGIPEILAGSGTAMVAPGRVDALSAAMGEALSAPQVLATRATRLRATMAQRFTVAAMADAVLDHYGTATEASPAGSTTAASAVRTAGPAE